MEVQTLVNGRIVTRAPTAADLALIIEVNDAPIPFWTPKLGFGSDREMWRASHGAMGIHDAAGFYSGRNLHALAALRHAILEISDPRSREALMFAFHRVRKPRVSPLSVERQASHQRDDRDSLHLVATLRMERLEPVPAESGRRAALLRALSRHRHRTGPGLSTLRHGPWLPCRPLDRHGLRGPLHSGPTSSTPDSSLLWDAWLGEATDQTAEIVVNQRRQRTGGGKDVATYGALLTQSFGELSRVLRPSGRGVLAFSNCRR